MKLNFKLWSLTLGTAGATSFVLCVVYGSLAPAEFHAASLLEQILPGFRWLSAGSFFLGLVESFLWGVYIALLVVPIHNLLVKRLGPTT